MRVGVPKEIKNLEFRVGMVPAGVAELVHDGHEVFVETNAGAGIVWILFQKPFEVFDFLFIIYLRKITFLNWRGQGPGFK